MSAGVDRGCAQLWAREQGNQARVEHAFGLPDYLYPTVPVLGVLLTVFVISQMDPLIVLIGSGIIGIGVLWFFAYARSRVIGEGLLRDAISPKPPVGYRVVVPVSNPRTQLGLLRLAAATAHANDEHGTPELVAVNVIEGPRDAPFQNIEADRADHQRELLDTAHDIAEAMDVDLRTRAIVAPDIGEAVVEAAEQVDCTVLLAERPTSRSLRSRLFG